MAGAQRGGVTFLPLDVTDALAAGVRYHAETHDFEQIVRPAPPYYAKPVVVVIDAREGFFLLLEFLHHP